jgi:hypothetical protein
MKKLLLSLLLSITLVSCGAKKKLIENSKQAEKIDIKKKVDSTSVKKENVEIQKTIETENDDFVISVSKSKSDSTDKGFSAEVPIEKIDKPFPKVKIKSPNGKLTEIDIPHGYDFTINSNAGKKQETENSNKKTSDSTSLKSNLDKKVDKKENKRNVNSDREEAVSFNRTFAIVLGVIILLVIIFLYVKYKMFKPK